MTQPDILCIGAVLWDIIGRSPRVMTVGSDVPGRITRLPGGVALNIAMALKGFGLSPALLTVVGRDAEGDELIRACDALGLITRHIHRAKNLPTDCYMAIEGAGGVVAAIADAHSLEAADDMILQPLVAGAFGAGPFSGTIVLDGNLTLDLLRRIATDPLFAACDLRLAPASPGKAERLLPFLSGSNATLYVNLEEAGLLLETAPASAAEAAADLRRAGARRVAVTNGAQPAAFAYDDQIVSAAPPPVTVVRITGAGDTFMAGHIAAERAGLPPQAALERALGAAATYVSGAHPI